MTTVHDGLPHTGIPGHCFDADGQTWHKTGERCTDCGFGLTQRELDHLPGGAADYGGGEQRTSERIIEKYLGPAYTIGVDPSVGHDRTVTIKLTPEQAQKLRDDWRKTGSGPPPMNMCRQPGCKQQAPKGSTHCDSCIEKTASYDGDDEPGAYTDTFEATTTSLAPWFGSNRTLAHRAAQVLGTVDWLGIPFGGSMPEVPRFKARTIVVNDLHEDIINLARVIRDPVKGPALYRRLRRVIAHEVELAVVQERLRSARGTGGLFASHEYASDVDRAFDYFVAVWLGRNGVAGTDAELTTGMATRWTSNGGDTCVRFRSATSSVLEWRRVFQRCTFTVMDALEFVAKIAATAKRQRAENDKERKGCYCDPPFPDAGDGYLHKFSTTQQRNLARALAELPVHGVRVVCRFYDHPLIRELYPESVWTWHHPEGGRDQNNAAKPEVLLVAGGVS